MTKFTASTQPLEQTEGDVIILKFFEDEKKLEPKVKELDQKLDGEISELLQSGDFDGQMKNTATIYSHGRIKTKRIVLLGLGKKKDFNLDKLREAITYTLPMLKKFKAKSISILLSKILPHSTDLKTTVQAITETISLSIYVFS